jgi:hypothetical protein
LFTSQALLSSLESRLCSFSANQAVVFVVIYLYQDAGCLRD